MRLIDVRPVARPQRHAKIFAEFDALPVGEVLHVVSDHEPRPLRYEFERTRPGRFVWSQRSVDEHHWEAFIRRSAETSPALDPIALLRGTTLFAPMQQSSVATIAAHAKVVSVSRGRAIIEQGSAWPYLGLVLSGMLQACAVTPSGREVALRDYLADDFFGEMALVDGGASPARYISRAEDTQAMLLPRSVLLQECDREPGCARALSVIVSQSARTLVERIVAIASQPIVARLAAALLPYAAPVEGPHPPLGPLTQVRQVEFAAAAGTSKDLVSRALLELEAGGAVVRDRGLVVALDRARLEEFAHITKY